MKHKLIALTVALTCTFAGNVMAMTKEEYKAEKNRISADYKTAKKSCGDLKNNAKDICMAEAKGAQKVAAAEAEAQYEPSPKHTNSAAMAKADADYAIAKEKCDDQKGNAKDVCVKAASAVKVKATENAKVQKVSADGNKAGSDKMIDTKNEANSEKRDADYKVAKVRCDALSGDAKDSCVGKAKAQYGMK